MLNARERRLTLEGLDCSSSRIKHAATAVEVWPLIAAGILAAFYLASSLYIASHRLFWYDEILAVHVARLPEWLTVWKAAAHGVDGMSPVFHMVVRASDKMFGHSELAARLPSALAMTAGLLITFDCARRLTDGLHGLIALSVLTCSFLPFYGYEARSYAIYFMLSALSLWLWTCTRADDKLSAILFGVVLCLAVSFHYYAVLLLAPYGLWEASRWRPWQPPSPKLIAGVVGVAIPLAFFSGMISAFAHLFSSRFWAGPSFDKFMAIFPELFPDALFLLALIFIWIVLVGTRDKSMGVETMFSGESVGWLFLSIPLVGFLVSLRTHHFLPRYFIGALPGVAVGFACWLWRNSRKALRASFGVLLLLTAWGLMKQLKVTRHPDWINPDGQQTQTFRYLQTEAPVLRDGKKFLLFDVGMLHLEAQYYSKEPENCIMLLPANGERLPPVVQETNLALYHPMHFWQLDDLRQHASETALIDPQPRTLETLRQAGFQTEVRFTSPLRVVYLR